MHDLLALQALDTEADQLRHRMANLPERIEVDAAKRAEDEAAESLATLDEQRHELGRQQKRFDDEISSITSHVEEVEATLYGGTVRAPKELTDLQSELNSLKRHRRDVEDQQLDVMEQLEPVDAERAKLLDFGIAKREGIQFGERSYVPGSENRIIAMMKGQIKASIIDLANKNTLMEIIKREFELSLDL